MVQSRDSEVIRATERVAGFKYEGLGGAYSWCLNAERCDEINNYKHPAVWSVDMEGKAKGSNKNIMTKLLFYSGLMKATMRDFNQMGVSAEWRRSWSFGDPKQFIFL